MTLTIPTSSRQLGGYLAAIGAAAITMDSHDPPSMAPAFHVDPEDRRLPTVVAAEPERVAEAIISHAQSIDTDREFHRWIWEDWDDGRPLFRVRPDLFPDDRFPDDDPLIARLREVSDRLPSGVPFAALGSRLMAGIGVNVNRRSPLDNVPRNQGRNLILRLRKLVPLLADMTTFEVLDELAADRPGTWITGWGNATGPVRAWCGLWALTQFPVGLLDDARLAPREPRRVTVPGYVYTHGRGWLALPVTRRPTKLPQWCGIIQSAALFAAAFRSGPDRWEGAVPHLDPLWGYAHRNGLSRHRVPAPLSTWGDLRAGGVEGLLIFRTRTQKVGPALVYSWQRSASVMRPDRLWQADRGPVTSRG